MTFLAAILRCPKAVSKNMPKLITDVKIRSKEQNKLCIFSLDYKGGKGFVNLVRWLPDFPAAPSGLLG